MKYLYLSISLILLLLSNQYTSQVNLIDSQPIDYDACLGDSAFFNLEANGDFEYQWQKANGSGFFNLVNNEFFEGVNTKNLTLSNSQSDLNNNFFRCIVSDNSNIDTTISAKLTVKNPIVPINLKDTILNSCIAKLSWKKVLNCIDSFEVSFRQFNEFEWETFYTITNNFQTMILPNNTNYEWRLRSLYKNVYSTYSSIDTFSTLPCLPPTHFFVSDISNNSALVDWENNAFGYKIIFKEINSSNWDTIIKSNFNHNFFDNLNNNEVYEYKVASLCSDLSYSSFSDLSSFLTDSLNFIENTHSYWNPDSTGYKYLFKGGDIDRWSTNFGTIEIDSSKSINGLGAIKWVVPGGNGNGFVWLDLNVEDINLLGCNLYTTCARDTFLKEYDFFVKSKNRDTSYFIDKLFTISENGNNLPPSEWHSRGGNVFESINIISNNNIEDLKHISNIRIRVQKTNENQVIWIDEIKYLIPRGPAAIIHFNAFRNSQDSLLTPWLIENSYPANMDFTYNLSQNSKTEMRGGLSTTYNSLERIKKIYDTLGNWSVTTHGEFYKFLPSLNFEERIQLYSSRLFNSFGFKNVNWCFSIPTDIINPQIKKEINDLKRFNSIRSQGYPKPNLLPLDNPVEIKFFRPTSASAFLNQQAQGDRRTLSEMKAAIDKVNNIKGLMIFDFGHIVTEPSIDYNGSEFTMLEDAKAIIKYADSLGYSMLNFENLFYDSLYQQEISINHDYNLDYKTNSADTLDVLKNDLKPANSDLTIIEVGQTQYGTTELLSNSKKIVYNSSYANVKDRFWYVASDGTRSDTAWVFIKTSCFDSINIINNDTISCQQSLTLKADSISNATYRWYGPNGFNFNGFSPTIENMNRINTGQYKLIVSALGCLVDTSYINIIVNDFPILTDIISVPNCGAGPITLSAFSDRGNIKWFTSENGQIEINDDLDYDLTTNTLTINNLISTSSFYVEAIDGSCSSERQEVIATINLPTFKVDTHIACDSYTWIDGNTYTENNNTASFLLTNALGCDSIVTLNLIFSDFLTRTDTVISCYSYTWIDGITYSENNNTATYTIANQNGCDSLISLNLTINLPSEGIDYQIACNSYTWIDGNTYTENNNTATYFLSNKNGCDSIVTLNLTFSDSFNTIDNQISCSSFTWVDGNTYTSNNNFATYNFLSTEGCDSLVTLNLTINQPSVGVDIQEACDFYTWINGITYTSSINSATFVLTNSKGCDSIVSLNLTTYDCTEVKNAYCDKVLESIDEQLAINEVFGATNYEYEAFDGISTLTWIKGSNGIGFKMSNFNNIEFNKTYQVRIRAFVSGVWEPFGTYCAITTPENFAKIDTIDFNNELIIFPNPNDGNFTITFTKNISFIIYNELGQINSAYDLDIDKQKLIKIENLSAGIYFFVGFIDGKTYAEKIVID